MPLDRILLFSNSPRTHRYFRTLKGEITQPHIDVVRVGVALPDSSAPSPPLSEIIRFGMRRKEARDHYGPLRLGLFRRLYSSAAALHFHHAWREIHGRRPDAVGVWGGNAVDARAVVVAARCAEIPCFHFENGFLPNTTQMDLRGVNVASSVPRDPAFYRRYKSRGEGQLPNRLVPRKLPRARPQPHPSASLPESYIFVPFQVKLDSQILLNSPWIRSMEQLVQALSHAGIRLGRHAPHLVFKEHPSCSSPYPHLHELVAEHPTLHFANGHSTEALIRGSMGVITVNSTVGVEALLLNRPVLALGNAVYEIPGVTSSARGEEEVTRWMADLILGSLSPATLAPAFLRYLWEGFLVPGSHQSPGGAHFRAVAERLAEPWRAPWSFTGMEERSIGQSVPDPGPLSGRRGAPAPH